MRLREHELVVLDCDLPENGLQRGDVGTIVLVHAQGAAYEVEFVTLSGETIAVVTVPEGSLRPVGPREIAHVREVA